MLLECINKNGDQFKTYMLAFVRDRDYERIIEAVNKVDKTFNETTNPSTHNPALVPRIPSPVPAVPVNPYMQSFSFLSVPPCWEMRSGLFTETSVPSVPTVDTHAYYDF